MRFVSRDSFIFDILTICKSECIINVSLKKFKTEVSVQKEMHVIIEKSTEDYKDMTLEELLPENFEPDARKNSRIKSRKVKSMKKLLSMIIMVILAGALMLSMSACGKTVSGTYEVSSEDFTEPDVNGIMEQAESAYAELGAALDALVEETTVEETK